VRYVTLIAIQGVVRFMDDLIANWAIPHVAVPVSAPLLAYFASDDMRLPLDAFPPSQYAVSDNEEDEEEVVIPSDIIVEEAVEQALRKWKRVCVKCGPVFVSDCGWMMPSGDARCATRGHVYMAIKASQRVQEVESCLVLIVRSLTRVL
jgi:hypothetical protein